MEPESELDQSLALAVRVRLTLREDVARTSIRRGFLVAVVLPVISVGAAVFVNPAGAVLAGVFGTVIGVGVGIAFVSDGVTSLRRIRRELQTFEEQRSLPEARLVRRD